MTRFILWVFIIFLIEFKNVQAGLLDKLDVPKIEPKSIVKKATETTSDFDIDLDDIDLPNITKKELLTFINFKSTFNKTYATIEEEKVAIKNLISMKREVDLHNKRYEDGEETFMRGLNILSDLTPEDVNKLVNGFVKPKREKSFIKSEDYDDGEEENYENFYDEDENEYKNKEAILDTLKRRKRSNKDEDKNESLNYTAKGFIHPVIAQGKCGSCWSFASISAIEAQWFKKTGKLEKLSEQQLIDCDRDDEGDGNYGCAGGSMDVAFKFIKKFGKIAPCSDYPYEGNDTYKCKKLDGIVTVLSHENLTPGDENLLKKKLIEIGPIPIAVDASLSSFQTYKSGVYFDKQCTTNSNHAMLIVGFGYDEKTELKYWLIKNTYGKSWGLQGYMKLARDVDNHCGVAEYASYPIV